MEDRIRIKIKKKANFQKESLTTVMGARDIWRPKGSENFLEVKERTIFK